MGREESNQTNKQTKVHDFGNFELSPMHQTTNQTKPNIVIKSLTLVFSDDDYISPRQPPTKTQAPGDDDFNADENGKSKQVTVSTLFIHL